MMAKTKEKKTKEDETTNPVGRPLKFGTVEELQVKIYDYFESCHNEMGETVRPYTITGLAYALDTSRKVLLDYENRDDAFSYTIKRAKLKIENFAEESLFTSKQTAGIIFNMVNNYGWQNKQDSNVNANVTGEMGINVVFDPGMGT